MPIPADPPTRRPHAPRSRWRSAGEGDVASVATERHTASLNLLASEANVFDGAAVAIGHALVPMWPSPSPSTGSTSICAHRYLLAMSSARPWA